ncbi:MAG TPA: glycosyltransferase family 4 protein [Roseiflexaceae bacterium]|nr:glycosyltransferase family 4 protein [Roseiflexaceae bacterium]
MHRSFCELECVNLLYFTTAYESGIFGNRVHEEFLGRMLEAGHQATVLVPDSRSRGSLQPHTEPGPPPVVRVPVSADRPARAANLLARRTLHYDHFLTALRAYRNYLRSQPAIDIVHVESVYPLGAVAALAGDPRPFIPTIRGGDLIADDSIAYGFARFRSVRFLLRRCFARAALVRAVSPGARDMAIAYGCPPEKIVVVARNIRDDCFVEDVAAFRIASRRAIEARHQVAGRTLIVAAGRLLPVKGFDDLIRALPALRLHVPDATVLICGPNRDDPLLGDYAAYLRRLAAEHGVAEHISLVGHVAPEQMAEYLAAADAVAVPSLIEGGNKILVEGAALGTPFVATSTSGTIGFFDATRDLSVPPRAPAELAAALGTILGDKEAWRARSAACIAGRDTFRSTHVAREMQAMYRQAIAAQPAQPAVARGSQ